MAEVLVRNKNNGTEAGHWRRGDIVTIQPDGHVWGRLETKAAWIASGGAADDWNEDFILLKIPGLSVNRLQEYCQSWTDTLSLGGRSLWRLVVADVPLAIRNIATTNGELTIGPGGDVTRAAAQNYIRRKSDEALSDFTS